MWKETPDGIVFAVKVIPRASCNEIVGWENNELKIKLTAVPDQGKANEALIRFLADTCDVRIAQVKLLAGQTSRHKRICISGYHGKGIPNS